tara:strand:- start:559 stop:873 length:315 start_codon:yes stop_codon:yes gene_type:complete
MLIKDALNLESRNKLIKLAMWNQATSTDIQRKQVKGEIYAEEIMKIRMMSKRQLSSYLRDINKNKAVQEARKIKSPYLYRQFDKSILTKIELYSYAYNRMLALK